ncbi:MAG: T9SS type A sorting domain-containing protein [Bacteroidetes bacterium]|nr:T9SS type A sorting domain-containing protein [Bacteroidota bacterium]
MYPNPNYGSFNIGYKAIATSYLLKVIDVNGKVVHQQNLPSWSNEQSISLRNIAKGIYLLRIENNGKTVSRKFVVMDN